MGTKNISLTPELEKLVDDRVNSGRYTSASEVVREALRLMEAQDREVALRLKALSADIAAGREQLDRGQARELNDDALERIKRAGRAKLDIQG